uniref:Protein TIC 214 n=1 Tax=Genista tridentata subsp. tridentata TaxID=2942621 RepID=A0A976U7E6_9FABA|nr:Ycf1 protein [Genista tridentata subsp. tridentata]
MFFQPFILDNRVSLCMKIMNSLVVVGLYYGFLTTFSTGPSYLFLLRARAIEEGTEKKVSATTGFIAGQLMMFISIYYAPLHLALGRPYTITVIALPYLLFQLFCKNHKHFLNYGYKYKNANSIRNFRIPRIFFNNLIFQLLNPLFLPSSMLVRLGTIYLFRWNNKLLFLISSFVGWLLGHTFLMKCIGLILVCIKQKNLIQSNVPIRSNKYIMSELKFSMSQTFIVFLFITCLYYLGRAPSAFFIKKLSEIKERNEIDKKKNVERTSETAGTKRSKQGQKISAKEYIFPQKEKEKEIFRFQKPFVTILFDYKRWNRPFRYIKNDQFENVVRNEISQFYFDTCQSDRKERLFFTYAPNLSTFLKIIETKISLLTKDNPPCHKLSNYLSFSNEEKKKTLMSNEFINRAKVLDKEFIPLDIFEKRIRLCNAETKKKYLPKIYDPFLNGPCRGRIKKSFSPSAVKNETYKKNDIWINKIHGIVLNSNYPEFGPQIDTFYIKPLLTEISFFLNLINKFSGKSVSSLNFDALYLFREHKPVKTDLEEKKRKIEFLFDTIRIDPNKKTIVNKKKCIGIKEISKKVPRWSYKLIDELQQLEGQNQAESYGIRSRKAKRVVIFTNNSEKDDTSSDTRDVDNNDKKKELALIRYSQQPDFRRDIIKGSIRAQRLKILTLKLFQRNVYSPLFLDKFEKSSFFSLDIFEPMNFFFLFKNGMGKKTELKISDYTEKKTKESEKQEEDKKKKNEKEEERRIEIAEAWDNIIFAQAIRGLLLLTQSILRKYIILPSLIIIKNIVRILLFQFPEWSEDFRDWSREMYIKCTYNGVQLSEIEFPQKWLTDGIQIKILFPFRLKAWHRSKQGPSEKQKNPMKKKKQDFCFLTISGMEVELPFSGYPRNQLSFFDPILKEVKKKKKKMDFFFFLVLRVLNERTKLFLNVSKDRVKEIVKSIFKSIVFLNEKRKELPNSLFQLKKYELSESAKDGTINKKNSIIFESPILSQSINWTNSSSSLTEKKIKNLNAKTKTIRNKIQKMKKEKKREVLTSKITISSNKTTYNAKGLKLQKNSWQILQRRNARLKRKSHFFFFMKGVYIDIFLCIISIPRIILELFLESKKKIKKKSIYNNEANAERADKTSQSIIQLIKILKKYYNIRTTNSQNDLSSLSQAYVFYKLSQTQVIKVCKYNLRSGFEYHRRSFFLKNEIKDYFFGVHGIFHSKLRHKNPPDFVMNQWKNWLKGRSQYHLSESRWFRLVPQKWKNRIRINERHVAKNKDLTKCESYEKNRSILSKKQQVNSLTNKKKKIKKQSGYDLLLYKSINYVDKKCAHVYRPPFQANKKQAISYNYKTRKQKLFDITGNRDITNYIAEDYIIDMKKNIDRKCFDWIEMNVEIKKSFISNLESLLFSKFLIFYNTYMNNPWIIPIQLLLFNFNVNKNVSENKNITEKQKIIDTFRLSKKKKSLEFELDTRNQAKKKYADRVDPESSLSNQEKGIEEDSAESDKTNNRGIKKKKYKNKIEKELNFLLRKYLSFQLSWRGSFNQRIINNVKVYCLLIRLINLKEIAITSIQRGELSLDLMLIENQKDLTLTGLQKNRKERLIRKAILIVEPVRLFKKNDEQFIMYQTIIHKSKRLINQSCPEKSRIDKKTFDKSIPRDQKITENKEKNHYDSLVPENILSPRRRRELRILICFNPGNQNRVYRKTKFSNANKVNKCCRVLAKNKDLDRKKKKLINLKLFLWPIYQFEDLCCTNRYWFDTNNGSRLSILRIHIYPRLTIR